MSMQPLERPVARVHIPASSGDLLALLVLREIDASGPLSGLEAANRVAPMARLVGAARPGYRLLHDLVDEGLLVKTASLPPDYGITDAGRCEAEQLARRLWPEILSELVPVGARLAPAGTDVLAFVVPRPERLPPLRS